MAVDDRAFKDQGWFWLPDDAEHRVAGTLDLDDGQIRTRLLGHLPPDEVPDGVDVIELPRRLPAVGDAHPVVQCRLRSGHFFSLFFTRGFDGGGFRAPTVYFDGEPTFAGSSDLWSRYAIHDALCPQPPELVAVRFRLDGLAKFISRWRGVQPFKPLDDLGWVPKFFPLLPALEIPLNDDWTVFVESAIKGIDESIVFTVRSRTPRLLADFVSQVLVPLVWLARFTSHAPQRLTDMEVELPRDIEDEDDSGGDGWRRLNLPELAGSAGAITAERHWTALSIHDFVERPPEATTIPDLAAHTDDVRVKIFQAWFGWWGDEFNRRAVSAGVAPIARGGPLDPSDHFLAAIGALETLASARSKPLPELEVDERRKTAEHLQTNPDEMAAQLGVGRDTILWLAQRVRDSMAKGFARQLAELIEANSDLLSPLVKATAASGTVEFSPKRLAGQLASLRGSLSHTHRRSDGGELWRLLHQARVILVVTVLAEICPDRSKVLSIAQRLAASDHWYRS